MSSSQQIYSASITLSNIAVSLVQRRHYSEAVVTLEMAIKLLQVASQQIVAENSTSNSEADSSSLLAAKTIDCDIHTPLLRANQILAASMPSGIGKTEPDHAHAGLLVLTLGSSPTCSLRDFLLGSCTSPNEHFTELLAIRIEHDVSSFVECSTTGTTPLMLAVEVASSIALHNFAVAYAKKNRREQPNPVDVYDVPCKFMELSTVLMERLRTRFTEDVGVVEDLLPLSLIMHMTLRGLFCLRDPSVDTTTLDATISAMVVLFASKEKVLFQNSRINTAAAA